MKSYSFILIYLLFYSLANAATPYDPNLYFGGNKGCFVMHELNTQNYFKVSNSDCNKRYSPASTFKIPHSLIGLETGAIKDPNQLVPWDGFHYWTKYWNQDHTLYSAMKYSVVPYFIKLAAKVGISNMHRYLKEFEYGNQYFINREYPLNKQKQIFWLNNELKISANEQIAFLKKMYENELDVQDKNLKIVKNSIVQKKGTLSNSLGENKFILKWNPKAILSAKTGGTDNVGWLVGHIKLAEREFIFACVVTRGKGPSAVKTAIQILNDYNRNYQKLQG